VKSRVHLLPRLSPWLLKNLLTEVGKGGRIDFREFNKLLVPESQPFPLIGDMVIIRTRDCVWFTAFDINLAFWSIPIRVKDRHKTGFVRQ
jgi:hypothetical protein